MTTVKELIKRLEQLHKPDEHIAEAIWQSDDIRQSLLDRGWEEWVIAQFPQEYIDDILDMVDNHQDSTMGISWITLECAIDEYLEELNSNE